MATNLIVEKRNTVAIVTLNRPEVRNAFDDALIAELTDVFLEIERDDAIRAMVLAGAGKAFCAGADLNWMKRMSGYGYEDNLKDAKALAGMLKALDRMSKPTIARVHGPAYAGGVGLVAACDIAIGSQDAEFCLTEVKLGLSPATISPYVVRAMGERMARRYFLTGEVIDAGEAYRLRLLSDVCPPEELDGAVNALLGHLVVGGKEAHARIKDLVRAVGTGMVDDTMIADTAKRIAEIRVSGEGREGIASFLEKRKPAWVKEFEAVRVKPPRKRSSVFRKILIANRGEIACRVIAAARAMGIRTVAVYSDADRDARHVAFADEARRIGPAEARASYLNADAILAAARDTGAEAIHPGYGFLSENRDFAAACAKAGVVFIGPSPEAIAAMGDKSAAKRLMEKAGVPLVPGYHGENQDPVFLQKEADKIGYPVLIKASAGGGGKGMKVAADAKSFASALESAKREAKSAFGDDRVLVEKYLDRPRHIEVQVFGDNHGNLVYLFERDCSVQRRHQKVLEEAPAPGLNAQRRKAMGEAAVAAAKSIRYSSAGTVEFIAGQDGTFYFMEMNTRLQVEHPVTEMITGLDLVQWQLAVAAGEPLPLKQDQIPLHGHAIEARIYAENPDKGFLPSTGKLRHLRAPRGGEFSPAAGPVRVDSGVREGDAITPHYDPMIAKLVVWGESRATALGRMRAALADYEIVGVATNVAFLARTVAGKAFSGADLDTGLIERSRAELFPADAGPSNEDLAAAALAELLAEQAQAEAAARASADPHSPWNIVDGWRLNLGSHHEMVFAFAENIFPVQIHFAASGYRIEMGGREVAFGGREENGMLLVNLGDASFRVRAVRDGAHWHLFRDGRHRVLALQSAQTAPEPDAALGSLAAPMPGKVLQVLVQAGAKVSKGMPLVILEAMKMEHTIAAPHDGQVAEIHFKAGEQVNEGVELLRLER